VLAKIDLDNVLPNIKAPTLVMTSDRSVLQSVETVLRYQPRIPNSRLLVLTSDAYHIAVANADECVRNTLAFIRQAHPPPPPDGSPPFPARHTEDRDVKASRFSPSMAAASAASFPR